MNMTLKQENFCLAYIETGNASEAYRRAYDSENMKSETVAKRASEMLDDGDIAGRIAELRAPVVKSAQITLEQHLEDLKRLRDKAEAAEKFGPAIVAETARGKASGLYVDKAEITGKDGGPIQHQPVLEIVLSK